MSCAMLPSWAATSRARCSRKSLPLEADATARFMEEATDSGLVVYLGPGRYRFVHALFREALYSRLSSEQRLGLHRAAATCLSERYRDAVDLPVAQLAYHWFEASRGGFDAEAIIWCHRAARAAIAKRAYGEAIVQIEHALALLDLSDNKDPALRFELLSALGAAQYQAGQQGLSNLAWLRAALLAREQGWAVRLANAVLQWQYIRSATGVSHASAVSLHDAALEMLPADSDALRTRVLASKALAYRYRGEPMSEPTRRWTKHFRLARSIGDPEVTFDCLIKAFYLFAPAYDAPTRLTMLEEAVTLAPRTGREENLLLASAALFWPLSSLGRIDDMRARLEDLAESADAARHNFWRQLVAGFRVEIAILEGRWGDALRVAQKSLEQGALEGATGVEGRFGFQVFTIYRALGKLDAIAPLLVPTGLTPRAQSVPGCRGFACCTASWVRRPEALDVLEQLGDVRDLITDDLYETTLVYLADACVWLGDRKRCRATVRPPEALSRVQPDTARHHRPRRCLRLSRQAGAPVCAVKSRARELFRRGAQAERFHGRAADTGEHPNRLRRAVVGERPGTGSGAGQKAAGPGTRYGRRPRYAQSASAHRRANERRRPAGPTFQS